MNILAENSLSKLKRDRLRVKAEKFRIDMIRSGICKGAIGFDGYELTEDDVVKMCIASKFGFGNPLLVNREFTMAYMLDEYRSMLSAVKSVSRGDYAELYPIQSHGRQYETTFMYSGLGVVTSAAHTSEPWGNIFVEFAFDEKLLPFFDVRAQRLIGQTKFVEDD